MISVFGSYPNTALDQSEQALYTCYFITPLDNQLPTCIARILSKSEASLITKYM